MNNPDFEWFENRTKLKLSTEFKTLFRKRAAIEGKLFAIGTDGQGKLRELLSFGGEDRSSAYQAWSGSREDIPDAMLPFAYDSGDNLLCVNARSGAVYWIDHETMEPELISDSISSFSKCLAEPENEWSDPVETLAKDGSVEEARSFLQSGQASELSAGGRNLAQEASRNGNLEVLKVCVAVGQDLSGCIHLATMNCHQNIVLFLVEEAGVDVNERNKQGWGVIQCAMKNVEMISLLASLGAKQS